MNLIIIILTFFVGIHSSLKFEALDQKTGLTFVELSKARISYDTYTILYHIDISQYKNITKSVEHVISLADKECNRIQNGICRSLVDQARILLNHMIRDESDIEAYQQKNFDRKKRAIEFVGDFFHWAFGLMNAETAREYEHKIENLQNDSSRFHNLLQEQTILIKETLSLTNITITRLQDHVKKIVETINEYVYNTYTKINWIHTQIVFSESISLIKMLESEHHRLSSQILNCLEEIVTGKITQLIPEDRLTKDLTEISKYLKEEQKLPIDFFIENPLHIFKYSKIMSTLYGNRILMEVNIPIVERGIYTVYEIIPIPTLVNNKTVIIKPSSRHVLLNDGQKEFIPITSKEYFEGKFNFQGERIIKPAENAIIDFTQNCEISIFMQPEISTLNKYCDVKSIPTSNYFVSMNSNDAFYLRITKPLFITEYCSHLPAQSHEITESGILTLKRDCRIVTDKISLRPRINYNYNSNQIIKLTNHTATITYESLLAKVNLFKNISIPKIDDNILIQDSSIDFDKLIEKANKLVEKTEFSDKWNEIHLENLYISQKSYAFTILMAILIIIPIILTAWYFYNRFYKVDTWIKLAKVLSRGNVERVPQLFIRT